MQVKSILQTGQVNSESMELEMSQSDVMPTLKQQWADLKAKGGRIRDHARELGVTELELLATEGPDDVQWLDISPQKLVESVPSFGHVMALTRNELCVHERKGTYQNVNSDPYHILVLGEDIDLRLFPRQWAHALSVRVPSPKAAQSASASNGYLQSIQVFDQHGDAVHKIYLTDSSNHGAYTQFVSDHTSAAPSDLTIVPRSHRPDRPDADIDVDALRTDWAALQDTHDFFPMLRKHMVGREQALRLVGEPWAYRVPNNTIADLLRMMSARDLDIMCFVGNDGAIQIHSGKAANIVEMGPWINVMDPLWNLHLRHEDLTSVWFVVKPSSDGDIHSVEAFDDKGNMVVQFFGKRKPGIPELESWRSAWEELLHGGTQK